MPVIDWEKMGIAMASVAAIAALGAFVFDPTTKDVERLDDVRNQMRALPKAGPAPAISAPSDITLLTQQPIFVMSTGANAYKEKTVKLIGVSISPGRRAALIAIDGQPATWMSVGQTQDELVLIEVGSNAVRFDTPVGARTIGFNEPTTGGAG